MTLVFTGATWTSILAPDVSDERAVTLLEQRLWLALFYRPLSVSIFSSLVLYDVHKVSRLHCQGAPTSSLTSSRFQEKATDPRLDITGKTAEPG
jgi:hypothetical protein